jgi:hypothetical protein
MLQGLFELEHPSANVSPMNTANAAPSHGFIRSS